MVPATEIAATARVRSPRRSTIGAAIDDIRIGYSSRDAASPWTETWRSTCSERFGSTIVNGVRRTNPRSRIARAISGLWA